jgi:tRNA threonylcarbamoyladenosine biosynthesis protein TsaE
LKGLFGTGAAQAQAGALEGRWRLGHLAVMAPSESLHAIVAQSPAETAAVGARLAAKAKIGDVIFLRGGLGAGKTTLARGLIAAWTGSDEEAPSPTYTLVQTYEGPRGPLWHIDLYRLDNPDDTLELGLEEAFETAVVVIEWPERLGPNAPHDRLEVHLQERGEGRLIELFGVGRLKGTSFD